MKQSCTICCNCFCIGQGAKPDFVAGPGVPSFPESVGWVKGFSGLSSRSAALLTRTSAKKTRSEGLPLPSLGSFFYLRVTAAIPALRCSHAAALSVPGFDLQLAGLPGWSIFVTEDSLGDHWAVSDPDCCPQPHSWPWLATWHPISLVGHCSHQPPRGRAHHPAHLPFCRQVTLAALWQFVTVLMSCTWIIESTLPFWGV